MITDADMAYYRAFRSGLFALGWGVVTLLLCGIVAAAREQPYSQVAANRALVAILPALVAAIALVVALLKSLVGYWRAMSESPGAFRPRDMVLILLELAVLVVAGVALSNLE